MKQYVTFGQVHRHNINGKVFDKDCVAVFEAPDYESGRAKAFSTFGPKFCFHYTEKEFDINELKFFPRGLINLDKS